MKRKAIARALRAVGAVIFVPLTLGAFGGIAWVGYELYAKGETVPAILMVAILIGAAAMAAAEIIDGGAS